MKDASKYNNKILLRKLRNSSTLQNKAGGTWVVRGLLGEKAQALCQSDQMQCLQALLQQSVKNSYGGTKLCEK